MFVSHNEDLNLAVLCEIFQDKQKLNIDRVNKIIINYFGKIFSDLKTGVLEEYVEEYKDRDDFCNHFFTKLCPEIISSRNDLIHMLLSLKGIDNPNDCQEEIVEVSLKMQCGNVILKLLKEIKPLLTVKDQQDEVQIALNKWEGKTASIENLIVEGGYLTHEEFVKNMITRETGMDISTKDIEKKMSVKDGVRSVIIDRNGIRDISKPATEVKVDLKSMSIEQLDKLDESQINKLLDNEK